MFKFTPYIGELMGLTTDENHFVYRWLNLDCKVLFSAARKGKAMSIHIASDKRGLRKLKQALNEFCEFIFETYTWCDMILGNITRRSIINLAMACGFTEVYKNDQATIVMRCR